MHKTPTHRTKRMQTDKRSLRYLGVIYYGTVTSNIVSHRLQVNTQANTNTHHYRWSTSVTARLNILQ
jgi:hypothetical protein